MRAVHTNASARWVGPCYLRLSLFNLRLVFAAYGQFAWSFLLTVQVTVEIRFGLFCLLWNSVWYFLLTVPPVRKLGLVFFAYGSPCPEIGFGLFLLTVPPPKVKSDEPQAKIPQL